VSRLFNSCSSRRLGKRGFVLPSAIFLLVILAALAVFLVNISTSQSMRSVQDVQGTRAYHAARAGAEWALYQVLDPTNASAVAPGAASWPNMLDCPPNPPPLVIEGFTVSIGCSRFPAGAVGASGPPVYLESGTTRSIIVYQLTATAQTTGDVAGAANFVERAVTVTASKCRALDGVAPGYECP
jgi:MSHA biogenesis protein MshP